MLRIERLALGEGEGWKIEGDEGIAGHEESYQLSCLSNGMSSLKKPTNYPVSGYSVNGFVLSCLRGRSDLYW